MGTISLTAWERFHDRVVSQAGGWPRALWFAAVEDGLRSALPEDSRLLAEYCRYVAELQQIEDAPTKTYRDAQRVAQMEADIMRLIGHTDQTVRDRAAGADPEAMLAGSSLTPRREGGGIWLGALTVGVILFCSVLLGATYYQNQRMAERMERELVALQERLIEQSADQRAALEARIRSADRAQQNVEQAQAAFRANVAEFNQVMSQSVQSMTALSDGAVDELERRLAEQHGDVEVALTGLRERAATLGRGFDQVEQSRATLGERLPDLESGMARLAQRLETTEASFQRVAGQVETIKAQAPEIALWLEGHRQGLAQALDGHRQTVSELDFEINTLKGDLDESRGALSTFRAILEQDLSQAKQQADALAQALEDVRATEAKARELVAAIDARVRGTERELQERLDVVLSDLAKGIRRGQDAIKGAEAEAAGQLDAAAKQAVEDLIAARRQRVTELSQWAEAARSELAQTQAGLVAGWRGMDAAVAERQSQVLANLDRYAATLENRVKELLDALNVMVTGSSG